MEELIKIGKRRTILISISVLLISIHTIYLYHTVRPEMEVTKLIQQSIRFLLTIGLLIVTYKGKKWARITSIVLFGISVLGAVVGLATVDGTFASKIPLIVMAFVYSIAVYHFGFSQSYGAFFEYQNGVEIDLETDE